MAQQASTDRVKERLEQQKASALQQQQSGAVNIQEVKFKELNNLFERSIGELKKALPSHIQAERMHRVCMTAVRNNLDLLDCDHRSLLGTAFKAAQLGLEPDLLGMCHFVPFRGQVQLIIGYKGYIELLYRSNKIAKIEARVVNENDLFEYEHGTNGYLKHKPARKNRGKFTDVYAYVKMTNGAEYFEVMSYDEIIHIRDNFSSDYKYKKSKGRESTTVWAAHFDSMARKTVLHRIKNTLPLSIEDMRNLEVDNKIISDIDAEPERVDITEIANEG